MKQKRRLFLSGDFGFTRRCVRSVPLLILLCLSLTGGVPAWGDELPTGDITTAEVRAAETLAAQQELEGAAEDAAGENTPQFQVNAKAAVLIEAETGRLVYANNENASMPIASITKVMTMLLVMESIDSGKLAPSDTVTISAYACNMGGSQVYLKEGEIFTVEELLKAVAVHSANDAAVALAEKVAGSEQAFVALMNEKAVALKMENTRFLDCTGLTDEGHYSSANDVAVMSRELLVKHPNIVHYTTIWHDTFRDGKFDLDNTNKLVKRYQGTTGLKTGFTNKAGFCLSASAERNGTKFISVILGSESNDMRFSESARLLDYGFTNWESAKIEKKDQNAGMVKVKKGTVAQINLTYSEDATVVVKRGTKANLTETVELPEVINAPVNAGQTVGVLNIDLNGERLASIPIVAAETSEKASLKLVTGMVARRWATLFVNAIGGNNKDNTDNSENGNGNNNGNNNSNNPNNSTPNNSGNGQGGNTSGGSINNNTGAGNTSGGSINNNTGTGNTTGGSINNNSGGSGGSTDNKDNNKDNVQD